MMIKTNYFMMLSSSPWPFLVSLNIFNFLMSFIYLFNMKNMSLIIMLTSIIISMISFFLWSKDLEVEVNFKGMKLMNLDLSMKNFFILFILSEIMIFFSMFWSYYSYFLVSELEMMLWPSNFMKTFSWTLMPMINTLLLILSSITLTISHWMMNTNKIKNSLKYLIYTVMLGMIFTFLQMKEYSTSYYSFNDSNFGSIFFLLTGLHGLHVMLGSMMLLTTLIKSLKISSHIKESEMFEMSAWYWHFVDLVWIFVLYSLYYLN